MNSLFQEDDDPRPDTDVTLGIGSLLSIFFGVVLVCGIFFGFGYSMGRRNTALHGGSAAPPSAAHPAPSAASADEDTAASKPESETTTETKSIPAPASHTEEPKPATQPLKRLETPLPSSTASETAASASEKPAKAGHATPAPEPSATLAAVPFSHRAPLLAKPHAGIPPAPAAPEPVPSPGHPLMVQIAAVSRQEDAEVLAGALRKRGFSPQVHGGITDKFFHVQVGPFTDKEQAEAMKQHLLADGYNAILK